MAGKRPRSGSSIDKIQQLRTKLIDTRSTGSLIDKIPAGRTGAANQGGGSGGGGKGKN
jgi:hypothetical protein